MREAPEDLITPRRASQILHCCIAHVYRQIAKGDLPAWRRGGRYFLSEAEVRSRMVPVQTPAKKEPVQGNAHFHARQELRKLGIG